MKKSMVILGILGLAMVVAFVGCEQPTNNGKPTTTYTVTFDLNYEGATGTPAEQTITEGQKAVEPEPTPVRDGHTFAGWYTEAACTNKWDFASNTVTEDKILYAKWEYAVGSTGPAGGIIFYVNTDAAISEWTYLEAAPADLENKFKWDREFRTAPVITNNAIGRGAANTAAIIAALGDNGEAANAADEYEYGGKNDWFLPSKDELDLMYQNLKKENKGSFQGGTYWSSSSQDGVTGAWSQDFRDGGQYNGSSNNIAGFIRVIRSF